jgi:hypothetical protein
MQCPCGAETRPTKHSVSTPRGANEWGVSENFLPIRIAQDVCPSCGRRQAKIYSDDGQLVRRVG